jgi:polygalacturonase
MRGASKKSNFLLFSSAVIGFIFFITAPESLAQIPRAYADGIHKDTKAIQACIDSVANAGGGLVRFTPGKYLTAPLTFRGNNMTFQIDSGATILASTDTIDWYPPGSDTTKPLSSVQNFISASGFTNMTIQGKGTIDGQGAGWWPAPNNPRPRLLQLAKGKHLVVKNVTLTNSPMFHLCPTQCYDVIVDSIRIIAPSTSPNTDGIDPGICHKVRITNCYIDNGDDNVAVGASSGDAGWGAASTDIIVKNCTFMHGHGVSIGSYTSGGVDSMLVDSCTFNGTDNGIRIKSQRGRGGECRHITYSNLTMTNVRYPIYFTAYYSGIPAQTDTAQPVNSLTPNFHDLTVLNLTSTNSASNSVAGIIVGVPELPFYNIKLQNVSLAAQKGIQLRNATIEDADTMAITVKTGYRIIREVRSQLLTAIETEIFPKPAQFRLEQNYPNPFNPSTVIQYQLPNSGHVLLKVYSITGKEIQTLVNGEQNAGAHSVSFNATTLPSGMYLYSLQSGNVNITKKMLLLK